MKTASKEIRLIALRAYESGIPRQQIAEIVGYHLNCVSRWIREYERDRQLEARPRGHRASIFSANERTELVDFLSKNVDMPLEEIRLHFQKQCSVVAIHKIVASLGFVFKKNFEGKQTRSRRHRAKQT
jgi:transposase